MDTYAAQAIEVAESKWISCLTALCKNGDTVRIGHFDFQDNLRLRESVEFWEKTEAYFAPVAQLLRSEFAPLLFLSDFEVLVTCAYFLGAGPSVPMQVLAQCFSNVYQVDFGVDDGRPAHVRGAHGEALDVREATAVSYDGGDLTGGMHALSEILPATVKKSIALCLAGVPILGRDNKRDDSSREDRTVSSSGASSNRVAGSPKKSPFRPSSKHANVNNNLSSSRTHSHFDHPAEHLEALTTWARAHVAQSLYVSMQVSLCEFLETLQSSSPRTASVDAGRYAMKWARTVSAGLRNGGDTQTDEMDRIKSSMLMMLAIRCFPCACLC
jgi:hypothetical protein